MRRSPGFAVIATAALALGIGANAAMFSIVNGVLLKPLPFDEPDELVSVRNTAPGLGSDRMALAPPQYFTYREAQRAFEDVAVWTLRRAALTGTGDPEQVSTLWVTDGFLSLLRVQPVLGRRFDRADDQAGSPPRAIISYGCWLRRFGGEHRVLDRRRIVHLNVMAHPTSTWTAQPLCEAWPWDSAPGPSPPSRRTARRLTTAWRVNPRCLSRDVARAEVRLLTAECSFCRSTRSAGSVRQCLAADGVFGRDRP